ncbi:hypothetical protein BX600DRAFT_521575 [Xylariales sp. PMI_506]|nr:hypothetical protein BX600DRAFT_521575 [Xylariales sp. PMI_506]
MKLSATLQLIAVFLVGTFASPYLEFCDLQGLQDRSEQGVVVQAICHDSDTESCQELNIVPCFANAWGQITSSGQTLTELSLNYSDKATLIALAQIVASEHPEMTLRPTAFFVAFVRMVLPTLSLTQLSKQIPVFDLCLALLHRRAGPQPQRAHTSVKFAILFKEKGGFGECSDQSDDQINVDTKHTTAERKPSLPGIKISQHEGH